MLTESPNPAQIQSESNFKLSWTHVSTSNRRVTYIGVANDSFGAQVCGFRFPPGEWVVSDGTGRDYVPTFRAKRVIYTDICATLHTHLSECAELPVSAGVNFSEGT